MKTRMMMGLMLVAVLVAVPVSADTKLGRANPNTAQNWAFTPIGTGQVQIVLSWTKNNARLFMALVCGTSDPMTFGTASGTVNRLAVLQVGVIPDLPCILGVSSLRGSSAYRVHLMRDVSQASQGRGRNPVALEVTEAVPGSILVYETERVLERIRQLNGGQ